MSLFEDIKAARQDHIGKDREMCNILGVLIAEIQRSQKNPHDAVPDKVVTSTVKRLINSIEESIKHGGHTDKLDNEVKILSKYLPIEVPKMTIDELTAVIKESGFSTQKEIFAYLKANYAGKFDGKDVNTVINKL